MNPRIFIQRLKQSMGWLEHKLLFVYVGILFVLILYFQNQVSRNYTYSYSTINILNGKFSYEGEFANAGLEESYEELIPIEYGSKSVSIDEKNENKKMAICFAGGIREFELSGVSLLRNVMDYYDPLVTFFNIPLDEHTHKISIVLRSQTNVAINVVSQMPLNASGAAEEIMDTNGSPNGLQGLLLYFQLVEGCGDMVLAYEKLHQTRFKWIVRIRPDSFWNHPSLPISEFRFGDYIIPYGSDFGGYNDRLAISDRDTSFVGFHRLRTVPIVHSAGYRGLNSEKTLHAHLTLAGLRVVRRHFPFCVVTRRTYNWPMKMRGSPVGSLTSRGYLNGIKCRPCIPIATKKLSKQYLAILNASWGAVGNDNGVDLCNASSPWEEDWERLFDSQVDKETVAVRHAIKSRSYQACIKENMLVRKKAVFYNGPSISTLCILGQWGPFVNLGPEREGWNVLTKGLTSQSTVYSFGMGRNLTWEMDLISTVDSNVHSFDCTPDGYPWAKSTQVPPNLKLYDRCLGGVDGYKIFHSISPENGTVGEEYTSIKYPFKNYKFVGEPVRTQIFKLSTIMKEMNHEVLDLLRINIGEEFFSVFSKDWAESLERLPICQLVVDFGLKRFSGGKDLQKSVIRILEKRGLYLTKCFGDFGSEKCHFLSSYFCNL